MIDLRDTTFLIPIRLESRDRAWNFQYVIQYLCRHFDTKILIWESDKRSIVPEILRQVRTFNTKITYWFDYCEDSIFHRTRLLNEMLAEVKTPVCVNYDCDVVLDIPMYVKSRDAILNGADLIYPFFFGKSQRKIYRHSMSTDITRPLPIEEAQAEYGQVQFFNTDSYRKGGMENENAFLSWAPEDKERCIRFQKLGYKVQWLDGLVYHIEHARGINSGKTNPHFENNEREWKRIEAMNPKELKEYYDNAPYLKKYKMPKVILATYADKNYEQQQKRLVQRAQELRTIDEAFTFDRDRLEKSDFYQENKSLLDHPKGAGWWVWKPFFILESLKMMEENDILIYIDCGDWISSNFKDFLIRRMRNCDVLLTDGSNKQSEWCKKDTFVLMDCDNYHCQEALQLEAGIIVCKKTDWTIKFISEWLKWCCAPECVTDMPNVHGENYPGFTEHRHDQAILTNLKTKYTMRSTSEMRQFINCNTN